MNVIHIGIGITKLANGTFEIAYPNNRTYCSDLDEAMLNLKLIAHTTLDAEIDKVRMEYEWQQSFEDEGGTDDDALLTLLDSQIPF